MSRCSVNSFPSTGFLTHDDFYVSAKSFRKLEELLDTEPADLAPEQLTDMRLGNAEKRRQLLLRQALPG
ncbi:MAG: hypothetical protein SGJ20_03845 [Planctomycetota bacterium]|nr:hypothetical protein [Planctomycetota bacterium]